MQTTNTHKLYSNGYPFTNPLPDTLMQQLKRVDNKRASLILIDGGLGSGKTTTAVQIMKVVNKIKGLFYAVSLKIKNHPQLSLGGKEFTGCFRETHKRKLPIITYDEGGDFNRRGAISGFNQMINRLFETFRGFKIIVIICLPNFNVLDNYLFENQVPRLLIHIDKRTQEVAYFKAYSLSQMNWIRYWYDKLPKSAKHKCYSMVKPNFYGKVLNLSPKEEKQLDILSTYGKKELFKASEKKLKGYVTYSDIASKLNKPIRWVRAIITELKLKPKTLMGNIKMFDKSVIDILIDKQESKIDGRQRNIIKETEERNG
jgi:ABC-type dipeptide/oligopeptide/nickel transport system ATPase component